MFQSDKTCENF